MSAPLNPAEAGWSAPAAGGGRTGTDASGAEARRDMQGLVRLRRALGILSTVSLWIAGIGLIAMTGVVGWQVFGRYVLNDTPNWAEPLSLQFMAWFILLGAAVGVRDSVHLGLDLLHHVAPAWARKAMDLVNLALIAAFGLAMAWYGGKLAIGTWTATIPVLGWPGGVDFFPLILGGVLIALFAAERFLDTLIGVEIVADTSTPELL